MVIGGAAHAVEAAATKQHIQWKQACTYHLSQRASSYSRFRTCRGGAIIRARASQHPLSKRLTRVRWNSCGGRGDQAVRLAHRGQRAGRVWLLCRRNRVRPLSVRCADQAVRRVSLVRCGGRVWRLVLLEDERRQGLCKNGDF